MNFFKNISLFIISFLLIISLLEIFLRFLGEQPRKENLARKDDPIIYKSDQQLGWLHKPGSYSFKPWSKEGKITNFTINENGSRKISELENNDSRLIFIGGSLTQGWAVDDNENFVSFYNKLNPNIDILNFGVGGYGAYQSMLLQEKIIRKFENINHFIYGFISHHELRNVAAGSWLYLLNKYSNRGHISVPFASIDKNGQLKRNKPISYFKLPFSEKIVLIAKIEKRIMKLKSSSREKKKFEISKLIIQKMNDNSREINSKFTVLLLDISKENLDKYNEFFIKKNINFIHCPFPINQIIKGEGHPNEIAHMDVASCLDKNLK